MLLTNVTWSMRQCENVTMCQYDNMDNLNCW